MSELLVLYDSRCAFCEWCRAQLEARPQRVRLRFLCCRSSLARERFASLPLAVELVVVDAAGRYWVGPAAFTMCLWALEGGEGLAFALGDGAIARLLFGAVSEHRGWMGSLVGAPCHEACEAAPPRLAPYR